MTTKYGGATFTVALFNGDADKVVASRNEMVSNIIAVYSKATLAVGTITPFSVFIESWITAVNSDATKTKNNIQADSVLSVIGAVNNLL